MSSVTSTNFLPTVTININFSYGAIPDPATGAYSSVGFGESYDNNETPQSYSGVLAALQAENERLGLACCLRARR